MEIDIPRLVLAQSVPKHIQIHGLSDASEKAYGACIYIRSNNQEGKTTVQLLCAKSRVSPLKQVSLPRSEICGAVLLARLLKKTLDSTQWINVNITLWTDSTIVLAWISACHTRWKTFIANRVAKTPKIAPIQAWQHVPFQDNPADLISTGHEPRLLSHNKLWWQGPHWLSEDFLAWPQKGSADEIVNLPKQNFIDVHSTNT
jgi:hypothetical protein